jgi:hypothetical protein
VIRQASCWQCSSSSRQHQRHVAWLCAAGNDETEIDKLQELALTTLEEKLRAGVSESDQAKTLTEKHKELKTSTLSVWLKALGEMVYEAYLMPTNVVNAVETTRAQEKAAAAWSRSILRAARLLWKRADRHGGADEHAPFARSCKGRGSDEPSRPGRGRLSALRLRSHADVSAAFEKETFTSSKKDDDQGLILILTLLFEWVCYVIDPRITPTVLESCLPACCFRARCTGAERFARHVVCVVRGRQRGDDVWV